MGAQAKLAEDRDELGAAREGYSAAAAIFETLGMAPNQAHALQGLGRCLLSLGETQEGVARLRETRALWKDMKAAPHIAEIDELLATERA